MNTTLFTNEQEKYTIGWVAGGGEIREDGIWINSKKDVSKITGISTDVLRLIYNYVDLRKCDFDNYFIFEKWLTIRGLFDNCGEILYNNEPQCIISIKANTWQKRKLWSDLLQRIYQFIHIPGSWENVNDGFKITWLGNNALDLLGKVYHCPNQSSRIYLSENYDTYIYLCAWYPSKLKSTGFKWTKTDQAALPPTKEKISDAGYDITIIKEIKTIGDVTFYDTGIKVQPDFGYYFDLVPRSSISKTGYMLANNVGIIDRAYRGPIIVALRKVDHYTEDLKLPCKIAQIIPRHIVHLQPIEVDQLDETARGEGGFGSTDSKKREQ